MEGEEFDALVADIKANGLQEQIVIYEGRILDGRNRFRACKAAGVAPAFRLGVQSPEQSNIARPLITDPVAYVISKNIRRRHLNVEQRQDVLIKLIARAPEKSDRRIGKEVGVDQAGGNKLTDKCRGVYFK